jgi:hypothetical protein
MGIRIRGRIRWRPDPNSRSRKFKTDSLRFAPDTLYPGSSWGYCGQTRELNRQTSPTSNSPVTRPRPALTAGIGDYIVRTARNRALPCATRS